MKRGGIASAADRIKCPGCGQEFAGLSASWCDCLTEDRSLVCPGCGRCFCSQAYDWKRDLWNRATPGLKAKRKDASRTDFSPPKFLLREELTRPLVLIAEDNRLVHLLATKMIQSLGYGVVGATDGREALDLCRIYEPDLVLADALMPVMDGREMCERLKSDPIFRDVPVVIMSSVYRDKIYANEAIQKFKADDFLLKPIGTDRMQAILQRFIRSQGGN